MSDTPRTDEECFVNGGEYVTAEFSKKLERELTAARELTRQLNGEYRALNDEYRALNDLHRKLVQDFHRVKDTLATVIPALAAATGLNADEMRDNCPADIELTRDEWAALWMARAIMERQMP